MYKTCSGHLTRLLPSYGKNLVPPTVASKLIKEFFWQFVWTKFLEFLPNFFYMMTLISGPLKSSVSTCFEYVNALPGHTSAYACRLLRIASRKDNNLAPKNLVSPSSSKSFCNFVSVLRASVFGFFCLSLAFVFLSAPLLTVYLC